MIDKKHNRFLRALTLMSSVSLIACEAEEKTMQETIPTEPSCLASERFHEAQARVSETQVLANKQLQGGLKDILQKIDGIVDGIDNINYQMKINKVSADSFQPVWSAIQEQVGHVATEVSSLKKNLEADRSSRAKKKKANSGDFPFELIDVGLWGNEPFLSIKHQGEFYFLNVGEAFEGWQLLRADADSNEVGLKHVDGEKMLKRIVR